MSGGNAREADDRYNIDSEILSTRDEVTLVDTLANLPSIALR